MRHILRGGVGRLANWQKRLKNVRLKKKVLTFWLFFFFKICHNTILSHEIYFYFFQFYFHCSSSASRFKFTHNHKPISSIIQHVHCLIVLQQQSPKNQLLGSYPEATINLPRLFLEFFSKFFFARPCFSLAEKFVPHQSCITHSYSVFCLLMIGRGRGFGWFFY
jgi:hypothetical protein